MRANRCLPVALPLDSSAGCMLCSPHTERMESSPFRFDVSFEDELSAYFSEKLDVPVRLKAATHEAAIESLTTEEQAVLDGFRTDSRKATWRRGRQALKHLLAEVGETALSAQLTFPHPRFSLSHSQ